MFVSSDKPYCAELSFVGKPDPTWDNVENYFHTLSMLSRHLTYVESTGASYNKTGKYISFFFKKRGDN